MFFYVPKLKTSLTETMYLAETQKLNLYIFTWRLSNTSANIPVILNVITPSSLGPKGINAVIYGLDPKVATLKWCPWKIDQITFMKQEIKQSLIINPFGQVVEF